MEYVASQPHIVGLNEQCKEEIIGQVVESGGLNVEEEIIGGAVLQSCSAILYIIHCKSKDG